MISSEAELMKHTLLIITILLLTYPALAQEEHRRPTRTPEEEAMKQTEMLQRELALTDQQYDTIYRIHLKYARMRQVSNTRAEMLERLNKMMAELINMLTPEQQVLFLGKQMDQAPRRPQQHVARMCQDTAARAANK